MQQASRKGILRFLRLRNMLLVSTQWCINRGIMLILARIVTCMDARIDPAAAYVSRLEGSI